jgi:hypothetical protein
MQMKETLSRRPLLSPLLSALAVLMSLAVALEWGFSGVTLAQGLEETPDVVLVMKDRLFHILKGSELGKSQPTFLLAPKRDVVVLLRMSLSHHCSKKWIFRSRARRPWSTP